MILLLILALLLVLLLLRPLEEARLVARALIIAVFLAPVVFMVLGSLRDVGLPPPRGFELIPEGAGVEAYRSIGEHVPLARLLRNSAVVALLAVPVTVVVASWAGFAMAQLGRPLQRLLLGLILGMLVIPLPMV
ncbi:MAG: hypothetical protein M3133_08395, partial [Actinomycetota bacterium]|nr:hypothetical protein [Actinomycetota bacterium]